MSLFPNGQTNFEHTFAAKVTFLSNTFFGSDVTISESAKLTVSSISSFEKQVTFTDSVSFASNINVDRLVASSAVVSGISTFNDIHVGGRLFDGDDNFGTAGQVLSSDGTDLEWINTSSANVGSATNVGTNLDNTDADQWITFIGANSGNNPTRVDDNLRYNPSTNTMSGINYSGTSRFTNIRIDGQLLDGDGDFGSSGQVLASDGTDTNWVNTGSLTAGAAADVGITDTDDDTDFHPTFVASTSGNDNIRVDTDLTYNASTNTLTAGNFSGNGSNLNTLNASELDSGTVAVARLGSSGTRDSTTFLRGDNTWQEVRQTFSVVARTSAHTLTTSDVGTIISITTGGVTVPSATLSAGDTVLVYNNSSSSQTITQGSSVTLRLPGTSDTGNRTLQQRGLITILCIASNEFLITGTGLL